MDFNAATDGIGTRASPRNHLRGISASHSDVNPGTHVIMRGTYRGLASNFGSLRRGGNEQNRVYYIGNDPSWGTCTFDGSDAVLMTPCADAGEAFGNPNWQSLVRGDCGPSPAYAATRRGFHEGPDLRPMYLAQWPDLPDDEWNDINHWPIPTVAEMAWPNATYQNATSRPRIDLNVPGREALKAALTPEARPIMLFRGEANHFYEAQMRRTNAAGNPDPDGEYLTAETPPGGGPIYSDASQNNRFAVFNLPAMVTRPGRVAYDWDANWALAWPRVASWQIARAGWREGLALSSGADFVSIHGVRIGGIGRGETGSQRGYQLWATGTRTAPLIEYCDFLGKSGLNAAASLQFDVSGGTFGLTVRHCLFRRSITGGHINTSALLGGAMIYANIFQKTGGTAFAPKRLYQGMVVRGNLFHRLSSLHGNGVSVYGNAHDVTIADNVFIDCDRPITSNREGGNSTPVSYDPQYGPPSLKVYRNRILRSGLDSSAFGFRTQGVSASNPEGLEMVDNIIVGRGRAVAFTNSTEPVVATGNVLTGIFGGSGTGAKFPDATNTKHAAGSAEELALIDQAQSWAVDSVVVPLGVGPYNGWFPA